MFMKHALGLHGWGVVRAEQHFDIMTQNVAETFGETLLRSIDGESTPTNPLRPFPADEMKAKEAHKDVGNVRNSVLRSII